MTGAVSTVEDCFKGLKIEYDNGRDCEDQGVNEEGDDAFSSSERVEISLLKVLEEQSQISTNDEENAAPVPLPAVLKEHAYPCRWTMAPMPPPPEKWPQRPVMIRPTPGSDTKIRGIRHVANEQYVTIPGLCSGCILPINNGTESEKQALVIDFETKNFVGTLLMRIKGIKSASDSNRAGGMSYFHGKKRTFQAIVKGRFKTPLKVSECFTGQTFNKPAKNLPPKWIVSSFVKFVSALAPQLDARIHGNKPCFLAPLVATAHTVISKPYDSSQLCKSSHQDERMVNYCIYQGSLDIEKNVEEPHPADKESVVEEAYAALGMSLPHKDKTLSLSSRMSIRKRAYNAVAAKHLDHPRFSTEKEYTFEFYQHLLLFDREEFLVNMGTPVGTLALAPVTNGQPLKFMSAHKDPATGELDSLWSFDIWHESVFKYATEA